MFQVLGSATSTTKAPAADGSPADVEAEHGLRVAGEVHPEVDAALERESTSGVEWLPRHAPHRRM